MLFKTSVAMSSGYIETLTYVRMWHFDQACKHVIEEGMAKILLCGSFITAKERNLRKITLIIHT